MKLESLKLEKFNSNALKKEQMLKLNGGLMAAGTATPGGTGCSDGVCASNPTGVYNFDYGYDAIRTSGDGSLYVTYHNRTNSSLIDPSCCNGL